MYDMTIRLQTSGKECLYEQIYEHIKQEIREGKLLAGERLPSARSLAEYLQVSRSTVDAAYGQLVSEGYLEARPCKGYFAAPMEELFRIDEKGRREGTKAFLAKEMREEDKESTDSHASEIQWDFSPHEIDMSVFPFSVWNKISKNILTGANSDLFSQGEPQGDYDLRMTISRYLHSSRGVNSSPEQIVVGAGNDYLLLLLEKILGRHVPIAMENPTYKRAYRIFASFAYPIVTVDMDENGMKVSGLERENVGAAYVMPSHQFPTGIVMPIGRRTELLGWAAKGAERYLIEDDYDSEFRYQGKPIPSLQASDEQGRVIYIGTFSKSIAPAIRVSYMVLPRPLLERYRKNCGFYSCTVSRIDQRILNEFIRGGYFERHLNKMRKLYRGKHELLLECLKPFERKFRISGENAGLHLLLTALEPVAEERLIAGAAGKGARVYGLSDSLVKVGGRDFLGKTPSDEKRKLTPRQNGATVLLGFGGLTEQEIREGTERLKEAWLL